MDAPKSCRETKCALIPRGTKALGYRKQNVRLRGLCIQSTKVDIV